MSILSFLGMGLIRLISHLPLWILYRFSDLAFVLTYYIVRYRRKRVWLNLENAFPEKDIKERKKIGKAFYKNLCDYGVETIKLLTIHETELKKRMDFANAEIVLAYLHQGQSVLLLASHQFNWEWLLARGCLEFPTPTDFVYQPVNSVFFDKFSLACRTRFGGHAIKRNEVAQEIWSRRKIARGIAIVADQYPGYVHDSKYITPFLNQDTAFFYGTNQLALMTQMPAFFVGIHKVKRGKYLVTFKEIAAPPYQKDEKRIIENYARELEKAIAQYPSEWLWSHNRWKNRHINHPESLIWADSYPITSK